MATLPTDVVLDVLRALGEETRLQIAVLLQHGELTVTDLTDILGQSQPRISRHLKVLTDAGVVDKHREGTWVFFDLVSEGPVAELVAAVLSAVGDHDAALAVDLDRLAAVRARRAANAQEYFARVAPRWDEERSLHAADEIVEAAIVELASQQPYSTLLDLGTGTGRMLQLLTHTGVDRAVGLDTSHSMLAVARSNLERAEVRRADLRQGDVYSPPFERRSFDLVILHQVLHFLDDPARAIREAARLLRPGGRLLVVDFAPHSLEFLRTEHSHRRLGFRTDTVSTWMTHADLDVATTRTIEPPGDGAERLTVCLWVATAPANVEGPAASADTARSKRGGDGA